MYDVHTPPQMPTMRGGRKKRAGWTQNSDFICELLLSGPRNLVRSQARGKASLRSSVLYFLAGRRSSASTSTGSSNSCSVLRVFLSPPTNPTNTRACSFKIQAVLGSWNDLATADTPEFLNYYYYSKAGEILSTSPNQYTPSFF
jgi:hypothetical protein